MPTPMRFPRSYENRPVRAALETLTAAPSMEAFGDLTAALVTGGLAVDLTGSTEETGRQARTLPASDGGRVLPLFTSLAEIRKAVAASGGADAGIQAAILPAREALALVEAEDCVAAQLDPGSQALVIARPHIEAALRD